MDDIVTALPEFEPIFSKWREVHRRYHAEVNLPGEPGRPDCIYWCTERSNVGALAVAAWQAGFVALEEFRDANDTKNRSCDLWVRLDGERGVYVEAKLRFCKVSARCEPRSIAGLVRNDLDRADVQLKALDKSLGLRLAVTFFVPYWPGGAKQAQHEVDEFLSGMWHEFEGGTGARLIRSWCSVSSAAFPTWAPSDGAGAYPGVLLVGRLLSAE